MSGVGRLLAPSVMDDLVADAEIATATPFGGISVQGGVTTATLNAVVAQGLPGPGAVFLHVDWCPRRR